MPNPVRIWQLISFALAMALIASLAELSRSSTASHAAKGTLTTVKSATNHGHLALSPNARRIHERYSL